MSRGYALMRCHGDKDLLKYLNKRGRRNIISTHLLEQPGKRTWVCVVRERWWKRWGLWRPLFWASFIIGAGIAAWLLHLVELVAS